MSVRTRASRALQHLGRGRLRQIRAAERAIAAVERQWLTEIGAAQFDTMKQALRRLGAGMLRR
jgi:hypothetical protein